MDRKGLSPLIATVLLIGITISLAALVMVWGQQLFKDVTEETGATAQGEITCTSKVQIDVKNASCVNAGTTPLRIVLDNQNEEPIAAFILRVYGQTNVETIQVQPPTAGFPLSSFNTAAYIVGYTPAVIGTSVYKVEVIPQIALDNGKLKACGQRIEIYSNTPATTPLTNC